MAERSQKKRGIQPVSQGKGFPQREALSRNESNGFADRVHVVIKDVHTNVASPLAAVGLRLELLRSDPKMPPELQQQLSGIVRALDEVITVLRDRNRDLRNLEKHLRTPKS